MYLKNHFMFLIPEWLPKQVDGSRENRPFQRPALSQLSLFATSQPKILGKAQALHVHKRFPKAGLQPS